MPTKAASTKTSRVRLARAASQRKKSAAGGGRAKLVRKADSKSAKAPKKDATQPCYLEDATFRLVYNFNRIKQVRSEVQGG